MRSWVLEAPGLENLALTETDVPEPARGQVRLRMTAASLNFRDTVIAATGNAGGALPLVPLSDGAGVVEAVGADVDRVAVGDRVTPLFFPNWEGGRFTAEHSAAERAFALVVHCAGRRRAACPQRCSVGWELRRREREEEEDRPHLSRAPSCFDACSAQQELQNLGESISKRG